MNVHQVQIGTIRKICVFANILHNLLQKLVAFVHKILHCNAQTHTQTLWIHHAQLASAFVIKQAKFLLMVIANVHLIQPIVILKRFVNVTLWLKLLSMEYVLAQMVKLLMEIVVYAQILQMMMIQMEFAYVMTIVKFFWMGIVIVVKVKFIIKL